MPVKPILVPLGLLLLAVPVQAAAPVTQPDQATVAKNQKVRIPVLANDSGGPVASTLAIVQAPTAGTATIQSDGTVLYANSGAAATSDTFTYRVASATGETATGTVTVTVSSTLKIANGSLNVPAAPPATTFSLVNAFSNNLDFNAPITMASIPGDTKQLYVCQRSGSIRVVSDITAASPTASTFLDLNPLLSARSESLQQDGECGLLGLAFHPNYATNHFFYIYYSVQKSSGLFQRLSRFTGVPGSSPATADPGSELILIEQSDPASNHNGGCVQFGADGYLYVSLGDGGAGYDSFGNAQHIDGGFFSGIIRIDVDKKAGNVPPLANAQGAVIMDNGVPRYSVPVDNPYVETSLGGTWNGIYNGVAVDKTKVRREFWATGMRNPWRFSFDPVTAELWLGDVGQDAWEEVDIVTKGGNYGWAYREGNHAGPKTAPSGFDMNSLTAPVYEYGHGNTAFTGYAVMGGVVYRGTRLSALTGKYIFSDNSTGNIWSLQRNGAAAPTVERLAGESGISAFGYDPSNQDILACDLDNNRILRLVGSTTDSTFPATLSATRLFADLTDLSPSPGLLPYTVNVPFWSDNAIKRRWTIIPDGTSQFTWSRDGLWNLPTGTIWVKHFDMQMQRGVASSAKRIETRMLVKNATGVYGVSYRWNDAGTEATLVADAGDDFTLAITDAGNPVPQTWHIPSRAECTTCHTSQAGYALSFNTRQLNLANPLLGTGGNQLTSLRQLGYLSNDPGSPNLLPRHVRADEIDYSVEARVRSYLAVNCSYCHRAGGTATANWDGRPELTLDQTGLINGSVTNNHGDPAYKLVVPGDSAHSVALLRMAATNGFTRMPPLASNVIDDADVALVKQWIDGYLPFRQDYATWRQQQFGSATSPQGDPSADPDGDGMTNQAEYLAGTLPLDATSFSKPTLTTTAGTMSLDFSLPANRSFHIDTSTDLNTWTPWDVPGNDGLPVKGGTIEFKQPATDARRFFRILTSDN